MAGTTAGFSGDGGFATLAQLKFPYGVTFDAVGNLYIADQGNNRIRKVDTVGNISTVAGTTAGFSGDGGAATLAQLNNPTSVSVDAAGNIYIADRINHRIRKVDTAGNISTVAGTTVGFSGDGGLATLAQLNTPYSVSVDAAGNLYIADAQNHRIRKVDTAGNISTVAGTTAGFSGDGGAATLAQLSLPIGVTFDDAGNLYIGDLLNHRIRKVEGSDTTPPTGSISIDAGNVATNTTSVTLTLTCNDPYSGVGVGRNAGSGCADMMIVPAPTLTGARLPFATTFGPAVLIGGADGVKDVYVQFRDAAGNTSAFAHDSIILDTVAPNAPAISSPTTDTYTQSTTRPTISGTAEAGASVNVKDGATSLGLVTATGGNWSLAGGSLLAEGVHDFYATAMDAAGNTSAASTVITYTVDVTAPVITTPANIVVEAASASGTTKVAAAITAFLNAATTSDVVDGAGLAGNNALAVFPIGTTTVTFTATDAAGNVAIPVTATVTVSDTIAPVISGTPLVDVYAEATATNTALTLTVPLAMDVVGVVSVTNNAPASFSVGTTVVTWTAADAAGNTSTAMQNVIVQDTTAPAITGRPLGNVVKEATGRNTAVALTPPSATDLFAVTVTNNAPAGGFPVGTTVVIWTATDVSGNSSSATQNVVIQDTTAPVISLLGSDPYTLLAGQSYVDAGATALDLVDGALTVTVNNPIANPAVEGVYTLTYNVSDVTGNAATQVIRRVRVAAPTATNNGANVQLTLTGTAGTVDIYSAGEIVFGASASVASGILPANTTFPYGVVDYYTSVSIIGGSKVLRLTFSKALPAGLVVYKVDVAGTYTVLPTTLWTQVNANSIDVTLTDGDAQTDLDGVADGVIHDPLAIGAKVTPIVSNTGGGGGGCTINVSAEFDPTMLLLMLFALVFMARRKRVAGASM